MRHIAFIWRATGPPNFLSSHPGGVGGGVGSTMRWLTNPSSLTMRHYPHLHFVLLILARNPILHLSWSARDLDRNNIFTVQPSHSAIWRDRPKFGFRCPLAPNSLKVGSGYSYLPITGRHLPRALEAPCGCPNLSGLDNQEKKVISKFSQQSIVF